MIYKCSKCGEIMEVAQQCPVCKSKKVVRKDE